MCAKRTFCPLSSRFISSGGLQTASAHRLRKSVFCFAATLSAKHYRSIFGTAISQARNDFDDDEFRRCILSNTISTSYGTQKIVGTDGA
jgi:hypothetical protein